MISEDNVSVSPSEGAACMLSMRRRGGFRTEYDEAFLYMYTLLGPVSWQVPDLCSEAWRLWSSKC